MTQAPAAPPQQQAGPAEAMPSPPERTQYASEFDHLMGKPVKANMKSIAGNELQTFTTYDGREIVLNVQMLKKVMGDAFLHATTYETATFIHYCMTNRLDPFRKQVYYIQYQAGQAPAFVTSWEVFLDRANRHPQFDGYESGIVWHVNDGEAIGVVRGQPCDFTPDDDHRIAGGWARIHRKDRLHARYVEVPLSEMQGLKYDKAARKKVPTVMWATKTTTMATKTPSARALRQSFPDTLGSLIAEGESADSIPAPPPAKDGSKQRFGFPAEEPPAAAAPPPETPKKGAESFFRRPKG